MNKMCQKGSLLLFLLLNLSVYAQREMVVPQDSIGSEVIFEKKKYQADSIQFNEYQAFVFQKEYGDVFYQKDIETGFIQSGIDLDVAIVKEIDFLLTKNNILEVDRKFMQSRFQEMHAMRETNPSAYDWTELEREEKRYWDSFEKDKEQRYFHILDRQYIGYVNKKGEKIVQIFLIDFGDDQHTREKINQGLIPIFTNTESYPKVKVLRYNLSTEKLIINEDV